MMVRRHLRPSSQARARCQDPVLRHSHPLATLARKQVHMLMPEDLHQQVKVRADQAGVSVTGYLLALVEADLAADPTTIATLSSLALRVRAIEVHLGLDSRRPGQPIDPSLQEKKRNLTIDQPGRWDGQERRRSASSPPESPES